MAAATGSHHAGFWKPASTTISQDGKESVAPVFNFSNAPLVQQRRLLPIHKHRRQILYAVETYGVVVIVGETACGKSTQIPQYLMENGWCDNTFQVVCTQPRRVAAQTLAQRVAQEVAGSGTGDGGGGGRGGGRGSSSHKSNSSSNHVGDTVGYSVRFDDRSSDNTRILYATDGILLREATLKDPLLSSYSVVMVDEAHERNLGVDALLGLLKKIRRKRKDLRVVICSATIDAEAFLDFFCGSKEGGNRDRSVATTRKRRRRWDNNEGIDKTEKKAQLLDTGTIISVDGRQHPVDVMYLQQPTSNYVRSTVETALRICKQSCRKGKIDLDGGDILCFLPGESDVDEAIRMTQDHVESQEPDLVKQLVFLPLYSRLPYKLQARVFRLDNQKGGGGTSGMRRIIFSTNMAETSVTVPRVTHVIDSGLVKQAYFDPKTDFERLIVVPTSKASAKQRAGRAGRLNAGQCYRLYTEDYFLKQMQDSSPPEILRTNLSSFILTLKALGVSNILGFDLMDMPGVDALSHGLETLYALGAMDDDTNLTQLGMDMSSFPCEPRVSRMLLESLREECSKEVAGVAGTLQVRSLFLTPRGSAVRRQQLQVDYEAALSEFVDPSGDLVTYANVLAQQEDHRWDREECQERFLDYVALQRVKEVRDQLVRFLGKFGRVRSMDMADPQERSRAIRKCVTSGFFFNVARLRNDGRYYTIRGGPNQNILVTPSPSSVFHSHGSHTEYILFCKTHDGSRGGIELSSVSAIDSRWLRELAPHYWK